MILHRENFRMSGSYYFALVGGGDRPLLELEFNHKKEKDQRMVLLLQVNPHASPKDIKLPITPTSRSFLVNFKLAIIYLFETRGTLAGPFSKSSNFLKTLLIRNHPVSTSFILDG